MHMLQLTSLASRLLDFILLQHKNCFVSCCCSDFTFMIEPTRLLLCHFYYCMMLCQHSSRCHPVSVHLLVHLSVCLFVWHTSEFCQNG